MRRFWKQAGWERDGEEFRVLLDGRPVRLPGGTPLRAPTEPLARAIAAEWGEAGTKPGGEMSFADVPLTRLAGTAQERIAPDPEPTIAALAKYAESDLLCYRAEHPDALVRRQQEAWQPWLDWAARELGAALRTTAGVIFVVQPPEALRALRVALAAQDANTLAALGIAVPALGSLVLGLAMASGRLEPERTHALSALDELFQEELWGEDPEAAARRARIGADIVLAARFMELCRMPAMRSRE